MKRTLFTSDWHPDHVSCGVSRFDEVEEAVEATIDTAIAEKVDCYVFAGDLCDPDAGPIVYRCVELALRTAVRLRDAGIPSCWMTGNHDVNEDGSGTSTLTPMRAVACDQIHVIERPTAIEQFVFLPFVPTSHTYDPDAFAKSLQFKRATIVSHLAVAGIVPGEETAEMPRGRDVVFPHHLFRAGCGATLVQGHYHRSQLFEVPGLAPIHVIGSLARLTFDAERATPGFLILEG